jgi:phage recombination protein Bet
MELQRIEFAPEQVQLIKSQIAPNANDNELKLFLYQCERTGLDPLTRQIYCIHRGGKMTIQTSIDGFRVIAERSGTYAGQDEPVFNHDDNGKLISAKITVYRFKGETRYPAAVGVAYWSEYVQEYNGKPSGLWAKMPHTMLAKVAEALALRKAYPQDLSGLYTGDEMQQADKTEDVNFEDVPDEGERKLLRSMVYETDLSEDEQVKAFEWIDSCSNYDTYAKIQARLEARKKSIDMIVNPSQTDIKKHLQKLA